MRYWTLFTLRLLARVGLSLAAIAFVIGQWGSVRSSVVLGDTFVRGESGRGCVSIWFYRECVTLCPKQAEFIVGGDPWTRVSQHMVLIRGRKTESRVAELESTDWMLYVPSETDLPFVDIAGVRIQVNGRESAAGQIDHWLVCLTFLIATIATSVRWRKSVRPAAQEPEA